jgi:asparagine synthase (glutamine-hydrolysing)
MCGIVGQVYPTAAASRDTLLAQRDAMRHRGPDDVGVWWSEDGRVGLGHLRLAIIDLSPAGHQPMVDAAGEHVVVFNGEIYNYQDLRKELLALGRTFRSTSDTEVLLEAYHTWGPRFVERLNGMFAFAIYDARRRRLFIARDRAGEKPLFYWHDGRRLAFASELKGLMADPSVPRRLNHLAAECYFAYGYVPGDLCMLEGVHKLPQASTLTFDVDNGKVEVQQYWHLPEPCTSTTSSAEELEAEFESLLEDSVRRQLMADVPVGILLSGGVDSTLVTAMAARVSAHPVKTFTISFPGHGSFDEGPYARMVAEHFGTRHTEMVCEPATLDLLPTLARQYDEPIADSSMIPTYLVSQMIRREATVALGGDGGDELFGGYPHYSWLQQQARVASMLIGPLRTAVATTGQALPLGWRGRNYLIGVSDRARPVSYVNIYFDCTSRRRLLAPLALSNGRCAPEQIKAELAPPHHTLLQRATATDFRSYLVDDILTKVDRASMLTSLEVRAPFLDYRLIEFAFGKVPDSLRANTEDRKILLRRVVDRLLPAGFDSKRKQGFSIPLQEWFRGPWGTYVDNVLKDAPEDLFDRRMVERVQQAHARGHNNTHRLFALTMFELWRREYGVSVS